MNILIEELTYPKDTKLVLSLIENDTSNVCFSNKDENGNLVTPKNLAKLYLIYTKLYKIVCNGEAIGLLSLFNENEISIFIEPKYQNQGIGTIVLEQFIQKIRIEENLFSLYVEIVPTNKASVHLFEKLGFIKTNNSRYVPINDEYQEVVKYVLKYPQK